MKRGFLPWIQYGYVSSALDSFYKNYEHVLIVNPTYDYLWYNHDDLDNWCKENHCFFTYARVSYNHLEERWENDGIGGGDYFFIATNDFEIYTLALLRWGS